MMIRFPFAVNRRPVPHLMAVRVRPRKRSIMALVNVTWTTQDQAVPPTTPILDSWMISARLAGEEMASVMLSDLNARSAALDVPPGSGYVVTVALASGDQTVIGPAATSPAFDVPMMLSVPTAVAVTLG